MTRKQEVTPPLLTLWDAGGDEARGSGHEVGGGEGEAAADALDGEEDEEGGGELHQGGDEEVHVDVPPQDPHPHDQTLVDDGAGEPGGERGRSQAPAAAAAGSSAGRSSPVVAEDERVLPHVWSPDQVHEGEAGRVVGLVFAQRLRDEDAVRRF